MKIDYRNIEVARFNEEAYEYVEILFEGGMIAFYCTERTVDMLKQPHMLVFDLGVDVEGYTYDTREKLTYTLYKQPILIANQDCLFRKIEDEKNGIRFEEMK